MDSGMFKGATFFKCQGNMVTAVHPTERQVRDVFFSLDAQARMRDCLL